MTNKQAIEDWRVDHIEGDLHVSRFRNFPALDRLGKQLPPGLSARRGIPCTSLSRFAQLQPIELPQFRHL